MTDRPWIEDSYRGQEVTQAQQHFAEVLRAAAGDEEIEQPLKHVKVKFTRAEGVEYISTIPDRRGQPQPSGRKQSWKLSCSSCFDCWIRLSEPASPRPRAVNGSRPCALYVGICPKVRDGCGKLFAKTRIDQDYCSRTCVSRAQVTAFVEPSGR